MVTVLVPDGAMPAYRLAAEEFATLYEQCTGVSARIAATDDGTAEQVVLIGSEAVNPTVADLLFRGVLDELPFRTGSDAYAVRSVTDGSRSFLVLAGGRGRSTVYAVYDFFERVAGCRWFWDGDRIPHGEVPLTGIRFDDAPRFEIRGLRYFAHRGLHRFRAELWGRDDWERELRWILKKRLNFLMLRLGHDDLFQRAFPESVGYPDNQTRWSTLQDGYNDRTTPWPLRYHGDLHRAVLQRAADFDLMTAVDCGTMTHWYTPTPADFLAAERPRLFAQPDGDGYAADAATQVWDIRNEREFALYARLTDTAAEVNPAFFHTIGLAERRFSDDREYNFRLKLFTYRKLAAYLADRYPQSKLLVAAWDLWINYTADEVRRLLEQLDPNRTLVLDYTSDSPRHSNFTNWGVMGKFPYIFGMFHGYSRNSDIRGNYPLTEERLKLAAADTMCRGFVLWPELSHSDTLMQEYFTDSAWRPSERSMAERVDAFCADRYTVAVEERRHLWQGFLPLIPLMSWSMSKTSIYNPHELFLLPSDFEWMVRHRIDLDEIDEDAFRRAEPAAVETLRRLGESDDTAEESYRRDAVDIARTVLARYAHFALKRVVRLTGDWQDGHRQETASILALMDAGIALTAALGEVLGRHEDFSLNATWDGLHREAEVNPAFEQTLKENVSNDYCRSFAYELFDALYLPELRVQRAWLAENFAAGTKTKETMVGVERRDAAMREIRTAFLNTPLKAWAPQGSGSIRPCMPACVAAVTAAREARLAAEAAR